MRQNQLDSLGKYGYLGKWITAEDTGSIEELLRPMFELEIDALKIRKIDHFLFIHSDTSSYNHNAICRILQVSPDSIFNCRMTIGMLNNRTISLTFELETSNLAYQEFIYKAIQSQFRRVERDTAFGTYGCYFGHIKQNLFLIERFSGIRYKDLKIKIVNRHQIYNHYQSVQFCDYYRPLADSFKVELDCLVGKWKVVEIKYYGDCTFCEELQQYTHSSYMVLDTSTTLTFSNQRIETQTVYPDTFPVPEPNLFGLHDFKRCRRNSKFIYNLHLFVNNKGYLCFVYYEWHHWGTKAWKIECYTARLIGNRLTLSPPCCPTVQYVLQRVPE